MATAVPYTDKDGRIVSYQIQVFRGRDSSGKKLKPYLESWKVPETYKSEKAIKKALEKEMGAFEARCKEGKVSIEASTLSECCWRYIELKSGNKKKSIAFYESLMPRIEAEIGFIRWDKLKPKHLDDFYIKLQKPESRKDAKAIAKDQLLTERNHQKLTSKALAEAAGICSNTVTLALKKHKVNIETAQKLSTALNKDLSELFDIVSPGGENGLSAKTVHHYHTFLHSVLEMARKKENLAFNPASAATAPTVTHKEAEFFEIDEIIQIRRALEKYPMKYRVMICLLADTGIRRGELFGIRWSAISFERNEILINRNVQRVKGLGLFADTPKGRRSRTIHISEEMASLLLEYKAYQEKELAYIEIPQYNKEGYLFIQENGNVMDPNSLNIWTKKFETAEGLPHIYPHKFRHSQASILLYSGIDLVTVAARLGHNQTSTTTDIYGHVLQKADQHASDMIAQALYGK